MVPSFEAGGTAMEPAGLAQSKSNVMRRGKVDEGLEIAFIEVFVFLFFVIR